MYETIHDPLTTYSGTPLPSLADAAQAETAAQGEADEAQVAVLVDPTPENAARFHRATVRHIAAARVLAACAARLTPRRAA
ncbi:MAG TPA: hypothetical protein VFK04_13095 [Gemmatimonadaceae bacterium]|nr:hypothetical protein [Gemmatimonadaceae bacterium]